MSTWVHSKPTVRSGQWVQHLLAVGLIFAVLFFTRAAEQTRDSLVYAYAAKTGQEVFHPHHLIYTPVIRLVYQICPGCDAVLAGQLHNIAWAAAGSLALFYLLRAAWNTRAAVVGVVLFLGLRGFWELSTQTTMYAPSAAILAILSAVLVTADRQRGVRTSPGVLLAGLPAVLLALAVLYHQSNILFVLPLVAYLAAARGRAGLRTGLLVTALAGLICLISYVLVYLFSTGQPSVSGFINFCLSYTSEICLGGQCKASPQGWGSLANLSPTGLRLLLSSLFWNVVVLPERLEALILPVFGLGLLALCAWHIIQTLRRAADWPLRLFGLAWFISYTGFFFWWLPSYQHPFVVGMVPLFLLLFLGLRDLTALKRLPARSQALAERLALGGMAAAALLIAGRNLQARILPLHQSPGDAYYEAAALDAAAQFSAADSDCVFLTSYRTWNSLRYYFDRQTAVQARHPMSFFFLNEPMPELYRIAGKPCVFVASTFVLPTYINEDYSDDPVSAYQSPEIWLAYLSWLLEIEQAEAGGAVTHREFTVMAMEDGDPYLRLLPSRSEADSLDDLFGKLDAALKAPEQPFQTWYAVVNH